MTSNSTQALFSRRLAEICDDMGLPAHGRQTLLAQQLKVTQGATKKWLSGDGYPTMDKLIAICDWAGCNLNWLVQGVGPKRIDAVDTKSLVLGEALETLPSDERQQVLDFIGYKIERSSAQLFTGDRLARYMRMLDAFKQDRAKNHK